MVTIVVWLSFAVATVTSWPSPEIEGTLEVDAAYNAFDRRILRDVEFRSAVFDALDKDRDGRINAGPSGDLESTLVAGLRSMAAPLTGAARLAEQEEAYIPMPTIKDMTWTQWEKSAQRDSYPQDYYYLRGSNRKTLTVYDTASPDFPCANEDTLNKVTKKQCGVYFKYLAEAKSLLALRPDDDVAVADDFNPIIAIAHNGLVPTAHYELLPGLAPGLAAERAVGSILASAATIGASPLALAACPIGGELVRIVGEKAWQWLMQDASDGAATAVCSFLATSSRSFLAANWADHLPAKDLSALQQTLDPTFANFPTMIPAKWADEMKSGVFVPFNAPGDWYWDYGKATASRVSGTSSATVKYGTGQWKNDVRLRPDRHGEKHPRDLAVNCKNGVVWQYFRKSRAQWTVLHTDKTVLDNIEGGFLKWLPQLAMNQRFKKPNPDNHQYYVDYISMMQIDWFFPRDMQRANKLRRVCA